MNAGAKLVGLLKGGAVLDGGGIEDDHIGEGAGAQDAAISQAEMRGGQAGHFADGFAKGDGAAIHGGAEKTAKGAVGARMGVIVAQGAGGGAEGGIGADHDPRLGEDAPHVGFAHAEENTASEKFIGFHEAQGGIEGVQVPGGGGAGDGLAGVGRVGRVSGAADPDIVPIAVGAGGGHLGTDTRAVGGVAQPSEDGGATALRGPRGEDDIEVGAGGGVGIAVGGDGEALGLGGFDGSEGGIELGPVGFAGGFQVRDLQAHAGGAGNLDGFGNGFEERAAFTAHVGGVDAAVARNHAGKGFDFVGLRVHGGGIDEAGAEAHAALGEGVGQQLRHAGNFFGARGARLDAHDGGADGAVADEHGGVDGGALGGQQGAVVRHALPLAGVGLLQPVGGHGIAGPARRGAGTAVAGDFRGDALLDFRGGAGFNQQIGVGVGVDINEAGRNDAAGGVIFVGSGGGQLADGRDAVAAQGDIGAHELAAAAVGHEAAADNPIVGGGSHGREDTTKGGRRHGWRVFRN